MQFSHTVHLRCVRGVAHILQERNSGVIPLEESVFQTVCSLSTVDYVGIQTT